MSDDKDTAHSALRGGKITASVEAMNDWLAKNPTGKCRVLCVDPEKTRKQYEGRGLDFSRVEFLAPPEPTEKPVRATFYHERPGFVFAAPSDWIADIKDGVRVLSGPPIPDHWPLRFKKANQEGGGDGE